MISQGHLVAVDDVLDVVDIALGALARRLPDAVSRDDLASVGKLALLHALEQCDGPLEEVRAYCYVRVRGALLDELRRLDPLSRRQRACAADVTRAAHALEAQLGRPPTDREVAAAAQVPLADVVAVRAAKRSADIAWDELADDASATPAERAATADLHACLRTALARLPANQALALRRYYLEDASLDDIAAELGVSRERARQVREAGEKKLRADHVVLGLWQTLVTRGRD